MPNNALIRPDERPICNRSGIDYNTADNGMLLVCTANASLSIKYTEDQVLQWTLNLLLISKLQNF
jgi:hypothetical protein